MNTCEAICYRMGQNMSDRYGQKFAAGVRMLLSDRKTYSFNYRVYRNDRMQYYQCQLVKPREERNEFVIGFKDVDEEMRRQFKQTRQMELQREIIEGLGSEYDSVLLVDPLSDTVSVYCAEDVMAAKTVGMNEHIAKPFDRKILARTLAKWLK